MEYEKLCQMLKDKKISFEEFNQRAKQVGLTAPEKREN